MAAPAIAIFDIGKTNKKITLFDAEYHVLHEEDCQFEEIRDEDGFACENLEEVTSWLEKQVGLLKASSTFSVRAFNVSAYGASMVHLNEQGQPATPLYNYLKPFPAELAGELYARYGGKEAFARQTASPPMGMLNSGLQPYWLKHRKPALFSKIRHSLHLPQYMAYLIHRKMHSEITSIGCHTGLWDYTTGRYHAWVYQEGLEALLPPVAATTAFEEVVSADKILRCGIGIHDSSAALVPYLMGFREPFMLLSTGTWNISLNPFNQEPLSMAELQKDCLNFISYQGNPVRASRIFLGKEHEHQSKKLAAFFHKDSQYHRAIVPNPAILTKLLAERQAQKRFYPQTMQHTGPLPDLNGPDTDLSLFASYEEAYHQLMLDLVQMQVLSLQLAKGKTMPGRIFISGGFCHNPLFTQLLASHFTGTDFCTTQLKRASALGAALLMHRHWNPEGSIEHLLSVDKIQPLQLPQLQQYQIA